MSIFILRQNNTYTFLLTVKNSVISKIEILTNSNFITILFV